MVLSGVVCQTDQGTEEPERARSISFAPSKDVSELESCQVVRVLGVTVSNPDRFTEQYQKSQELLRNRPVSQR